jgi:hypothetical protein
MKNVGSCGVVFLGSHLDQELGIFVQTFSEISLEIGRVSFTQHMFNPSRTLEGLQMQVPNANGRVRRFRRRQLLRIVVSSKKDTMEQFILVSPKIDKQCQSGSDRLVTIR